MLKFISFILVLTFGLTAAVAQTPEPESEKPAKAEQEEALPEIWVHLVGGRKFQVDEVNETNDAYWYKVGNIWASVDRTRVGSIEHKSQIQATDGNEPLRGQGNWKLADSARVERFYLSKFGRPLPKGAFGQSDLHTLWGLDHRNGMDISLHPDSVEGKVLISFLRTEGIPFLAFRGAIPRVATGPHIHIGNPSPRVRLQHHSRR